MSATTSNQPGQRRPSLLDEIATASQQARTWWAERHERHENIEQMKKSGLVPNWGWTGTQTKPVPVSRAVSEPAVPTVHDDAAAPKSQKDLEWAKVGGVFQGLSAACEATGPNERPASAPATEKPKDARQEEREKLERYSVMESI